MQTKKIYRSIHSLSLTICVKVDGSDVYCDFSGGMNSPRRLNGSFGTSNPKLQAAIEKHPRFGVSFNLSKVVNIGNPDPEPATIVTPDGTNINVPVGSVVVEPEVKEQPEPEKEVENYISQAKNGQEAKNELNRKFQVPWSRLKNLTQTRSEAAKLNIVYPNWTLTQ